MAVQITGTLVEVKARSSYMRDGKEITPHEVLIYSGGRTATKLDLGRDVDPDAAKALVNRTVVGDVLITERWVEVGGKNIPRTSVILTSLEEHAVLSLAPEQDASLAVVA